MQVVKQPLDDNGTLQTLDAMVIKASQTGTVKIRMIPDDETAAGANTDQQEEVHISQLIKPDTDASFALLAKKHIAVVMAQLLVSHNADVNATDENGVSPLDIALSSSKTDLAVWLLENGADPGVSADPSATPLVYLSEPNSKHELQDGVHPTSRVVSELLKRNTNVRLNSVH